MTITGAFIVDGRYDVLGVAISEPTHDEPSGQPERRIRWFVNATSNCRRSYPIRSSTEIIRTSRLLFRPSSQIRQWCKIRATVRDQ